MEQFLEYLSVAGAVIFVFVALGFCIFSHELGHFLAGKLMGLHIDAFSIGFRPIWRKKYKGVEYRIGWLPLGGYVELPQVDASDDVPKSADGTELPPASPKARIVTAVAGPLFNIISGLLIGCIVWAVGIPEATPRMREIEVLSVPENSPEYASGLRKGDVIIKLNGEEFHDTWEKFVEKVLFTIDEVSLTVRRGNEICEIRYTPAENPNAPGTAGKEKLAYPFFKPLLPIKLYPEKDSPAEKAGIKDGDIVIAVNNKEITGADNFLYTLGFSKGEAVQITVLRDGETLTFSVTPQPVKEVKTSERFLTGINMAKIDGFVKITSVMAGGAAADAGIKAGDILLSADDKKISEIKEMQDHIAEKKSAPVTLSVKRGEEILSFTLAARSFLERQDNPGVPAYEIGTKFAAYNHPNPFELFYSTLEMSWKSLRGIATTIGNKLHLTESRSSLKPSHMSSTLGIGMVLYNSIRTSPAYGIYLIAVISFALAIFNLLPLPVLDGGHIFFGLLEWITGKKIPSPVMKVISYIFVTLLIALTLYITFFDGKRLVRQIQGNSQEQVDKNASPNP
ncbi:MAG: site-2 protease family protein [Lentisphaeria bacterium]|nr:site-2 protease family protein [Lentisphaeria bacterium]